MSLNSDRGMARLRPLRGSTFEPTEFGCRTTFWDGKSAPSIPHDTHHYHVVSHRCGYGDDVMRYCREHDFVHSFLAERLLGKTSPVLWDVAHGIQPRDKWYVYEEATVQMFQRWLRANERPILADCDWDALKAEALAMLARTNNGIGIGD